MLEVLTTLANLSGMLCNNTDNAEQEIGLFQTYNAEQEIELISANKSCVYYSRLTNPLCVYVCNLSYNAEEKQLVLK